MDHWLPVIPVEAAPSEPVGDTRAISGHATEEMQRHYSTVNATEVEESIGKVLSLARARELLEASKGGKEKKRPGCAGGGAEGSKKKKSAS